jgi:hypothetical protein
MANITVQIRSGTSNTLETSGTYADTDAAGTKAFIKTWVDKTDKAYRAYILEGHGGLTRLTYEGLKYNPDLPPPPQENVDQVIYTGTVNNPDMGNVGKVVVYKSGLMYIDVTSSVQPSTMGIFYYPNSYKVNTDLPYHTYTKLETSNTFSVSTTYFRVTNMASVLRTFTFVGIMHLNNVP